MISSPKAYYNENDPFAAQWLRNLIAAGLIADGDVDERSIEDVYPIDLAGYTQCHFFAGVGGWAYAARLAGWPDSRPLWTGSCPCQPFSAAGKRTGMSDERHLWPAFFHLIEHGKPRDIPVFGEQVASPDGLAWLDLVQTDLEGADHTCWATDICAAGFGAPIIRQRLWWVAWATGVGHNRRRSPLESNGRAETREQFERLCDAGWLDSANHSERRADLAGRNKSDSELGASCELIRMANNNNKGLERWGGMHECSSQLLAGKSSLADRLARSNGWDSGNRELQRSGEQRQQQQENSLPRNGSLRPGPTNGFWGSTDWLLCRDDKWRPVEPSTFPLAHGVPNRVGRLRGYGNAINAQAAAEFLKTYMDCCPS